MIAAKRYIEEEGSGAQGGRGKAGSENWEKGLEILSPDKTKTTKRELIYTQADSE